MIYSVKKLNCVRLTKLKVDFKAFIIKKSNFVGFDKGKKLKNTEVQRFMLAFQFWLVCSTLPISI